MDKCHENKCICHVLENILAQQLEVREKCFTSCYQNLLQQTTYLGDTIPFLLYTQKGELFQSPGSVGKNCFTTSFYRIERISDCCATLRLLLPLKKNGHLAEDICEVDELVKTRCGIEVDLSCFCAIQCLSPKLMS
ncbi:CotY/CotZ family spore coat protein [Metabacillus malikii]|uniref:Spore coat protein Y/spore coat protein Z n=1 Tax=Metabacillus malikii TaxID=1504265 RepID=A0ABT9ZEI4_9BACI|nr:CotY/CotZ family spore coat protein [Metabacillus malikii]MDQ0230639.1 spore coat protein Y/spore coat protein Z [Metabacillus malikii]